MSFSETIFLFLLALIIFGPKKLPEIARQAGKWMNEFRRASNEFKSQLEQEIAHLDVEGKPTIMPPSPPPEGTTSRSLNASPSEPAIPAEVPATLAASEDEPLFAAGKAAVKADSSAPEELPGSDSLAPSSSQESHV